MNEPSSSRPEDLAALIEEIHGQPGEHPDVERWLAYHRGELPPEDEEALREHVVVCRECFDLVQAVAAFDADPEVHADAATPGSGEVRASSTEASWRRLQERLVETDRADTTETTDTTQRTPPSRETPSGSRRPRPRWLLPLAASLLVALMGLAGWSLHLQWTLWELQRPKANPVPVFLGAVERAQEETTVVSRPGPWTLVVDTPLRPGAGPVFYRLELVELSNDGERQLHRARNLALDESSNLTWLLPEGLPPGRYRIDLSARGVSERELTGAEAPPKEKSWRPIASYSLRVEEGPAESEP